MKVRCKFCNDVIMGDKKGKFIQCKCKSCYIDETEHYCRIGGNFVDIEAVIDFTEYNDLITENQQLKSTLEEIREYIKNNIQEGYSEVFETEIRWDAVSGDDLLQIIDKEREEK